MRQKRMADLCFGLFVLAFVCLLLSGGSRLIGSEAEQSAPIPLCMVKATFTCPPQEAQPCADAAEKTERKTAAQPISVLHHASCMPHSPESDANGNVIRQASYMRAVYQSFALGDGFA